MDLQKPVKSKIVINPEFFLFSEPKTNTGVNHTSWVDCLPVNQLTDTGDIHISISGSGSAYLDLSRTLLYVKGKIVKANGENLGDKDKVAPINLFLHSMWSQMNVTFNQKQVSASGFNYGYQSIISTLLDVSNQTKSSFLQSAFYYKDTAENMDATCVPAADDAVALSNEGLNTRAKFCQESKEFDMIGIPFSDIFGMSRYVINGVDVGITLVQNKNAFRLMAEGAEQYKLKLTHVAIRACKIFPDSTMIKSHGETIEDKEAIYPFTQMDIKTFSIAQGTYTVNLDDVYQGKIPSLLVCAFVDSAAYAGDYSKNPFNFRHEDVDSFTCCADNQALPYHAINTKFSADNFQEAYSALLTATAGGLSNVGGTDITRTDFKNGYTLFSFNLDSHLQDSEQQPKRRIGNLSLEVKLSKALPHSATLICFAKFPSQIIIDKARAVRIS